MLPPWKIPTSLRKNGYERLHSAALDSFSLSSSLYCDDYKDFLNFSKTERECVSYCVRLAQDKGFVPLDRGTPLKPGDKVFRSVRGKMLLLAVIGDKPLSDGANIVAAHIDCPKLDLKPNPLYEESELAFLKTHYYGGIRKYQWVAVPLEIHGVVVLRSGEVIDVALGQGDEPKFVITDLLPHLSDEQDKKPLGQGITGEQLNLLVGSEPLEGDDKERVKLAVLKRLYEKYGFTEDDFSSAELAAVPAFHATDVGLDGSMIGAYGQDDRVCAYPAFRALVELDTPPRTAVCVLPDKEEIGSCGVSGMLSHAFDHFMMDLCEAQNVPLRTCLENSFCLSADVTAAFDPNFPDVFDKNNAAFLNHGIALCKYTGHGGKKNASDASAELMAGVRRVLDQNNVVWQTAEMGKVDAGGGGTVSKFMANRNLDTLDAGVPLLAMHAPFELSAKLDCFMAYQAMRAVYSSPNF